MNLRKKHLIIPVCCILILSTLALANVRYLSEQPLVFYKSLTKESSFLNPPLLSYKQIKSYFPLPIIEAISFSKQNPYEINFYINKGKNINSLNQDIPRFINYFLESLKANDIWVNLSPLEKDRIIPDNLVNTDIGKCLLIEDYFLKQLVSYFTNPNNKIGILFWQRVCQECYPRATTINTFYKLWISPDNPQIYEYSKNEQVTAYIKKARLKVMMEEDYLPYQQAEFIRTKNQNIKTPKLKNPIEKKAKEVFKRDVLPLIEKEINDGVTFAYIRQLYYILILANYFKQRVTYKGEFLLPCSNKPYAQNIKKAIYSAYIKNFTTKKSTSVIYNFSGKKIMAKVSACGGIKNFKKNAQIIDLQNPPIRKSNKPIFEIIKEPPLNLETTNFYEKDRANSNNKIFNKFRRCLITCDNLLNKKNLSEQDITQFLQFFRYIIKLSILTPNILDYNLDELSNIYNSMITTSLKAVKIITERIKDDSSLDKTTKLKLYFLKRKCSTVARYSYTYKKAISFLIEYINFVKGYSFPHKTLFEKSTIPELARFGFGLSTHISWAKKNISLQIDKIYNIGKGIDPFLYSDLLKLKQTWGEGLRDLWEDMPRDTKWIIRKLILSRLLTLATLLYLSLSLLSITIAILSTGFLSIAGSWLILFWKRFDYENYKNSKALIEDINTDRILNKKLKISKSSLEYMNNEMLCCEYNKFYQIYDQNHIKQSADIIFIVSSKSINPPKLSLNFKTPIIYINTSKKGSAQMLFKVFRFLNSSSEKIQSLKKLYPQLADKDITNLDRMIIIDANDTHLNDINLPFKNQQISALDLAVLNGLKITEELQKNNLIGIASLKANTPYISPIFIKNGNSAINITRLTSPISYQDTIEQKRSMVLLNRETLEIKKNYVHFNIKNIKNSLEYTQVSHEYDLSDLHKPQLDSPTGADIFSFKKDMAGYHNYQKLKKFLSQLAKITQDYPDPLETDDDILVPLHMASKGERLRSYLDTYGFAYQSTQEKFYYKLFLFYDTWAKKNTVKFYACLPHETESLSVRLNGNPSSKRVLAKLNTIFNNKKNVGGINLTFTNNNLATNDKKTENYLASKPIKLKFYTID